jgi:hypothetical protein
MKKLHEGGQRRAATSVREPRVGIFWLVDGEPLVDGTPLRAAEDYGDFKTHPRSHLEAWSLLQQNGIAPPEVEYEEFPRGRVMYNPTTRRFTLLADRCILRDKNVVAKIMLEMNLPNRNTDKGTDAHYRCSACLRSRSDRRPLR